MALTKVDISLVDNATGFTIVTKIVTVAASKYVIDGVSQDTLTLTEGYTYKFDTSHTTNATHHFKFSTTSDGTHGSGVDYTTGVTYNGTSGSAGAYTQIVVAASAPTLYYWCHHHASMGGTANTPAAVIANKLLAYDGSGNIPIVDGSQLTNVATGITNSTSDPTISTNPSGGVGTQWNNKTSGEVYICTDATAGENVWTNVGAGTGDVKPPNWFGVRGLTSGGSTPTVDIIDYITIATTGNAIDFGNLIVARRSTAGTSSGNGGRAIFFGSYAGARPEAIDYVTIATPGNAADFGDLGDSYAFTQPGYGSNGTRGLIIGGEKLAGAGDYYSNVIQYVTIDTTGNGIDFGDMYDGGAGAAGALDGTYCRFAGAYHANPTNQTNTIESVTVATTGNAIDWADLTVAGTYPAVVSSEAGRGVFAGRFSPNHSTTIDYITIATQANAIDFGDTTITMGGGGGMQNATRGCFNIGLSGPPQTYRNEIDYITIATTGNSVDFGDLTAGRGYNGSASGD